MAVRRNPAFRFDYFLRSLPVELLARRCEQLMRAAEKEVEHLERKAREDAGLPVEGENLPPIALPKFRVIQALYRKEEREKVRQEREKLQKNVDEIERQIQEVRDKLRALNEGTTIARVSPGTEEEPPTGSSPQAPGVEEAEQVQPKDDEGRLEGAIGPDGDFVPFPVYDGTEEPVEWKKPFTQFCVRTRKEVKQSLDAQARKDKVSSQALVFSDVASFAVSKHSSFISAPCEWYSQGPLDGIVR